MAAAWLRVLYSVFAFPLLLAWVSVTWGNASPTRWTLLNFFAWPFVLLSSVLLHELGHATVGWLVGLYPRAITVGVGREVARWKFGNIDLRLNALPLLGLTFMAARSPRAIRLKMFLGIAAGPATTGLVLLFLLKAQGKFAIFPVPEVVTQPAILELAVFINALMLATNLLPLTFSAGFRSDGRLLLSIPFLAQSELEEVLSADLVLDAQNALERHDLVEARRCMTVALAQNPQAVSLRATCATIEMEAGNYARAREQLLALRAEEPPNLQVRLVLANNLAWLDFLAGDLEHLAEADKLSDEVAEKFGSAAFALGTRGAVLLWMGRVQEACGLLERAHTTNTGKWARAINACCLTLAYAKRGDFTRAKTWLEEAQTEDAGCTLLPRARASLQGASLATH